MKKRILVLLAVALVMAAMLVAMAAPAFANAVFTCTNPNTGQSINVFAKDRHDIARPNGYTECTKFTSGPG
jgi:ABC-type cobalt transport system substrate-binding protein